MERVVITGQGAISALGVGVKENWSNLKDGVCGIDNLDIPDVIFADLQLLHQNLPVHKA